MTKSIKTYLVLLTTLCGLQLVHADESVFSRTLSDLNAQLDSITKLGLMPTDYRSYMGLYSQNHREFLQVRDSWIRLATNLPASLSTDDKTKLDALSENKFLQQLSLDEVTYYAYVYESWVNGPECKTRIFPVVNGLNQIYGSRNAPFGLTQKSSLLVAYYLAYTPPAQSRSIHACFTFTKLNDGATFLKIPSALTKKEGDQSRLIPQTEILQAGTYQAADTDFQIVNSSVGVGLFVYNFCYTQRLALEGRCFSDFGKQSSSRRD
jgi:hypothetical protein